MVYFLYGEDDFRLRQKVKKIIESYKVKYKSGLNLGFFDLAKSEAWEDFKIFINSASMFAEKKLAVLESPLAAGLAEKEKLAAYFENNDILKTTEKFLVIAQPLQRLADKKKTGYVLKDSADLFKKLTKTEANPEEFVFLSGAKLEGWIKKETEERGGRIDLAAIKQLALAVGADLWRLDNEINKLISYRNKEIITVADVAELAQTRIETDIFKTIDALAERREALAWQYLSRHLASGESEIYLLARLVSQFRNLLLIKDQMERGAGLVAMGKKIKLHPYVLQKSFAQAKNFSLAALKKIYERLLEIDLAIKSGQLDGLTALDLVVKEIVG
ncbi:MAG: DNA polymerase III subunit delta [Patescibacteria group bacterium]